MKKDISTCGLRYGFAAFTNHTASGDLRLGRQTRLHVCEGTLESVTFVELGWTQRSSTMCRQWQSPTGRVSKYQTLQTWQAYMQEEKQIHVAKNPIQVNVFQMSGVGY